MASSLPQMNPTPLTLDQAQLFLDDTWIDDAGWITRVWHQARKYPEPVLRAEHPWEANCPVLYGTVLKHEGRFRMWYPAWTRNMPPRLCYAESDDGVNWTKPRLGLCETAGGTDNNVILTAANPEGIIDDCTVIDDPEDRRWPLKMLYWDSGRATGGGREGWGIHMARSSDGIHWEDRQLVLPEWGDRFNAMPHKQNGHFVLYGRAPATMHDGGRGRRVWRIESPDLVRWTPPRLVLERDTEDPPHMQFYSATTFDYESVTLGSIERMHMVPDKLDPELIFSHDGGWSWRRARTRPRFIEWGQPGRWDSHWINLAAAAPIRQGNHLWFYYSGRSGAHAVPYPHNHGAIGLATLRLDGFASLRAYEQEGQVLTRPMTWPEGDLMINYDARRDLSAHPGYTGAHVGAGGGVRVAVLTPEGEVVQGYGVEQCALRAGNSERLPGCYEKVTWGEGQSLTALAGRVVRLRFHLRDAHLYAFKAGG